MRLRIGVLVAVVALIGLPVPAQAALSARVGDQSADWPQVGFDGGRSFHNPDEHVLTRQTVPTLSKAWKVPLGVPDASGLVVSDGVIYVDANPTLWAVSETTHEVLWTRRDVIGDILGISHGVLITRARYPHRVTEARSPSDGHVIWTLPHVQVEALEDGMGYGLSEQPRVVAVDLETGRRVWRKGLSAQRGVASELAVSDQTLLLTTNGSVPSAIGSGFIFARGYWIALDAKTGTRLTGWQPCNGGDPYDLCMYEAGTFDWKGTLSGTYLMSASAVDSRYDDEEPVAFSSCGGASACRIRGSFSGSGIEWLVPAPVCCYPEPAPVLAGGVVYYRGFRRDGRGLLVAFSRDGHLLVKMPLPPDAYFAQVVVNGTVYVMRPSTDKHRRSTLFAYQPHH
jgi:outer membrane protein assembly factor BamB